ncbi:DUF6087 family protein [Streptomyces sp. NPDC102437]|uniref:DUF6087 family protein n=1 Tax=Streptomyces sp. NPDC102437 TaxID=3366175 RepID=UPI003808B332
MLRALGFRPEVGRPAVSRVGKEIPLSDEPLDEWAERRDARRPAPGARRAVPLGDGSARGAHVAPDTARGMLEWDGHQWVPSGVAGDHAAAVEETGTQDAAERVRLPRFGALPLAPEPWRPTEEPRRPRPGHVPPGAGPSTT